MAASVQAAEERRAVSLRLLIVYALRMVRVHLDRVDEDSVLRRTTVRLVAGAMP